MNPQYPIYILSKGRSDPKLALTARELMRTNVPFRMVIEADEHDDYARLVGADRLIVLDPAYIDAYDACMNLDPGQPRGSGPARNFIWDHAVSEGHAWHWVVDDNIRYFVRLHKNHRIRMGDGTIFAAIEDFAQRYKGIALAAPHYKMFAPSRAPMAPFITGTRVMSCILIRNDIPFRWRGRYNEDIDLSLRVLKAGWQTIVFFALLQDKLPTQQMRGGNTDTVYVDGTLEKSKMLVRLHPDVTRLAWRFGRWHHHVDYSQWLNTPLVRRDDYEPPAENPYRLRRVQVRQP